VATQILSLGILFACMGTASDCIWAALSSKAANLLRGNARWMRTERYGSGGILISLGVATAFAGHTAKK
jgi:threonine/homoserine/homoserine lactone efflux protein